MPNKKPKSERNMDRARSRTDSKLKFQDSKLAPKKSSLTGENLPNKMYLPKREPAKAAPSAPAPKAQKTKYKGGSAKKAFGNVKSNQKRQKRGGLFGC